MSTRPEWQDDGSTMTVDDVEPAIAGGAALLDVRTPDEWRAGHAAQAVHIPLDELAARVSEVPSAGEVIVVCRSGRRSGIATEMLNGRGRQATNLTGGMKAWVAAGKSIVAADGTPGQIA